MIDMKSIENFTIDKSCWTKVKFGDVVFEPKESVKDLVAECIEHVVGLEHIDSEDIHLRRSAGIEESTTFTKKFSKGDVLFGRRRAYLKKAAKVDFEGVCSGDITVMRAKENLLPNLLPYIVNNNRFFDYSVTHSAGGLSPRVKFIDLKNYDLTIPPISSQEEYVHLLEALDNVIESEKALLKSANVLFKCKEYELLNSSHYISEGVLDVATVQRGKFTHRPRNAPQFYGGEIPFIQTGEVVRSGKYITEYTQTLNELGLSISKMFPKGTIVMTIAANIGYVGILDFESAFTDSLVGIKANDEKLDQEYLYYYLSFKQPVLDNLATESAQKNLSIDTFKYFKVRYPEDMGRQRDIVRTLGLLQERVEHIQDKLKVTTSLRSALIYKVF